MSAFGTADRAGRAVRANTPGIGLTGLQETLSAPGLAFQTGASQSANQLAELQSLIGDVGQTARAATGYLDQQDAIARRQEEEALRQQARSERLTQGLADMQVAPLAAKYGALVQTGKYSTQGKTLDQVVNDVMQIEFSAGQMSDPVFAEQARRSLTSSLAAEFQTQQAKSIVEADATAFKAYEARFVTDPTPDGIAKTQAEINSNYGYLPESQRVSALLTATERAAKSGSAGFDSLVKALPESYAVEKETLGNQYKAAKQHQATLAQGAAVDAIGSLRYSKNYTGAMDALDTYVRLGTIDGEQANSIRKGIEEEQRATLGQSKLAIRQAEDDQIKTAYRQGVGASIDANIPFAVKDLNVTVQNDDGSTREVTMDREKAIDAEMQKRLSPDGGFPAITQKNLELASKNNYAVPQWKELFAQAGSSLTAYTVNLKDGKLTDQVAQNVVAAFAAYKQMRSMDQGGYIPKISDDKTTAIFEIAARNQQLVGGPGGGTPAADAQAVISALRQYNNPRKVDATKLANAIGSVDGTAFTRFFTGTQKMENTPEVVASMLPLVAMKANIDEDTAIEQAIREYTPRLVPVNGFYHLAQADFPGGMKENMNNVFGVLADEYLAKYGKSKSITKEQLTMRPDPNAQVWHMVLKNSDGFAPFDSTKDVVFTYDDLAQAYSRWSKKYQSQLMEPGISQRRQLGGFGFSP